MNFGMSRKRKGRDEEDDPPSLSQLLADRIEIMKLTAAVKSWEFTCSFCFRRFASAQAMGGHQNAHRGERLEERKLFVRDPIGYRKRAYLQAMRAKPESSIVVQPAPNPSLNLHAATQMVERELSKINRNLKLDRAGVSNAVHGAQGQICTGQASDAMKKLPLVPANVLPPKELDLAEKVGIHGKDEKGKKCVGMFDSDNDCEVNKIELDLTLKL